MNIAVVVGALAAVLSVYVAALSWRFSAAPGWRDQHWFALAALCSAIFAALNVPILMLPPGGVVLACNRLQLLFAALQMACWVRYTVVYLREPYGPLARWGSRFVVALGVAALVPGIVYRNEVRLRTFEPIHVVYRDPVTTWFGDLALLIILGSFVLLAVRFARAARRGVPHARTHAVALCCMLALAGNDALNAAGVITSAYLIELAYVIPVGVVGYVLTARFAEDARALASMRAHLETLVELRTRDLTRAQEALHRSEKLASLGQLAAGVAHEVSSPAAVVAANLAYLEQQLTGGGPPEDGLQCVRECAVAMRRIGSISRQLLDAGQLAASGAEAHPVCAAEVAREALTTARARCPPHVTLRERVPGDLWVMGEEDMLHQVLVNLVVNGVQAMPAGRGGTVEVSGRREAGRALIVVQDDGEGMPPEVLRRVFEPFFTTKPFGTGSGLGLAVSRGLIAGLGGDLRLTSEVGQGTQAVVDLPEAAGAALSPAAPRRQAGD